LIGAVLSEQNECQVARRNMSSESRERGDAAAAHRGKNPLEEEVTPAPTAGRC